MERNIERGTTIHLLTDNKMTSFIIDDILGLGGSCVAYNVTYFENETIPHKGVLKEYCPAYLTSVNPIRNGTVINIPDELYGNFVVGLNEFKNTYKYINQYLAENISATNFHPVQIGMYEGNNTAYTLTSCDYGMTYDKIDDKNLLSICKIMLSVTKGVEFYHKAGFLHLDIKPKNILILNDVTELIKLFDYDSLTSIEKIKNGEVFGIPAPEDYYVPELESYKLNDIDIQTDIFEIGAMLFLRVFKRSPEISDMSYDSVYDVDKNELFVGVSPQAKKEFTELLKKTIQISKRLRYQSTQELKEKLERIISLISDEKPYLIDMPKWQPSKCCIGRKDELKEIHSRLNSDGYVFIKGIGGLGKSELAKLYAKQYAAEYHTVQFYQYSDNLKSLVTSLSINGIDEKSYSNADELAKTKNRILHLSDSKTLIVVDNFNVTYDDFLREFLPTDNQSFKVIFTTRCTMAAEYYESKTYCLPKLSLEECKKVFFLYCPSAIASDDIVEKIIEFIDYNTLIVVLVAITMQKSGISASDMSDKLQQQETDSIEAKIFHEYDFSSEEVNEYNKINAHLTTIFSVCGLTELQNEILKNATLISMNGIGVDEFVQNCHSKKIDRDAVVNIIDLGWLNKSVDDVITMHPIVSDLVSVNEELCKKDSYYKFADYLEDFCNPEYCHFSIVLNKLACAKHLDRRYKFESEAKVMVISAKLGRMYAHIYQPINAKKYLKKALNIAIALKPESELFYDGTIINFKGQYKNVFITYIYYFLGEVEQDFGTKNKAIDYYQKCIEEGKKLENRFYSIVVEAMMSIAECYSDNNNNNEAYNSYLEALNYSKRFKLNEYISIISDKLIEICKDLNWIEKESDFIRISDKYRRFADDIEELPGIFEFSKTISEGDFKEGLTAYENMLSVQRESLGEDSPMYKDLKNNLWVLYAINGHTEQAMHLLNEDLNFIAQTSGDVSVEMANQLSLAANIMIRFLDFSAINKFAKRAISICEQLGDTQIYAFVEANLALATMLHLQGKDAEAKEYVDAIDFSAFSGNEFLSDMVRTAGIILCDLSEFDVVEPLCMKLLDNANIDFIGKFQAFIILSVVNEQKGLLETAEYYSEEAKKCIDFIKTDFIKNEWLVLYYRSKAKIRYRKGDCNQAIKYIDECIAAFDKKSEPPFILNTVYLERGLYNFYAGQSKEAEADYRICENILTKYKLPESAFVTLYNNISLNYEKSNQFEKAKEYLERIVHIKPTVLCPTSYFETIVCGNIGWIDYNLGNVSQSVSLMKRAIIAFENLGMDNVLDYFKAKNNLAIAYTNQEKYLEANNEYMDIRKSYNPDLDADGEMAVRSNFGIIFTLLKCDKAQDAYNFACEELNRFETWFGKISPITVNAVLQMGGIFREFGYSDCYDFFFIANDLMEESKDYKSLNNAKLLNYLGLYLTDEKKEHGQAKLYFEESKELFEELNATDDDVYPVVLKNIEYVRGLIVDELISDMAKSLLDDTQEDE